MANVFDLHSKPGDTSTDRKKYPIKFEDNLFSGGGYLDVINNLDIGSKISDKAYKYGEKSRYEEEETKKKQKKADEQIANAPSLINEFVSPKYNLAEVSAGIKSNGPTLYEPTAPYAEKAALQGDIANLYGKKGQYGDYEDVTAGVGHEKTQQDLIAEKREQDKQLQGPLGEAQDLYSEKLRSLTGDLPSIKNPEGKPSKIEELYKKFPILTKEEVEEKDSFGKKLLMAIGGGLQGDTQLYQRSVRQQITDSENRFNNEYNKLMAVPKIAAERVRHELETFKQRSEFVANDFAAASAFNDSKLKEARSPEEYYNRQILQKNFQIDYNRAELNKKAAIQAANDLDAYSKYEWSNNPLAVPTDLVDPVTGRPQQLLFNSENDKKYWTDDNQRLALAEEADKKASVLLNEINKTPGAKGIKDKDKNMLFAEVLASYPGDLVSKLKEQGTKLDDTSDYGKTQIILSLQRLRKKQLTMSTHPLELKPEVLFQIRAKNRLGKK